MYNFQTTREKKLEKETLSNQRQKREDNNRKHDTQKKQVRIKPKPKFIKHK